MNTIENSICEAITILVDRAVSQASYDKTIQGTIVRCEDATIGKYTVRYQDSLFYAYASNSDVTYRDGVTVYILVPSNDMSKQKTIIGTTEKLGINYIAVAEGDQAYQYVGNNIITETVSTDPFLNNKGEFMLSSYQKNDNGDNRHVYTLYQAILQNEKIVEKINKLKLDLSNLKAYMAESSALICGAYVKTSLENKQQQKGDYGILFRIAFEDNATGQIVIRPYIINVDKMIGNPYKFTSAVRQYGIFDIDGANFKYVESISIFEYDFPYSKETSQIRNPQDYDIFFSNFSLMCANRLTDEQISTYALLLHTPRGAVFSGNEVDSDTRSIQAEVRVKGKTVKAQTLPFYWFVEDAGVASDSIYYCKYGGRGWRCLNQSNLLRNQIPQEKDSSGKIIQEYQPPVFEWVPGSNNFILEKGDLLAQKTKIKCAVVYDNTVITKQITFRNLSGVKIEIVSDSGTQFYYDTGTPTLTCLVDGVENVTINSDGTRRNKNYAYTWSAINNTDDFTLLVKEEDFAANTLANDNYNKKVVQIKNLQTQIDNQTVLKASATNTLNTYKADLVNLDRVARETTINTVDARVDINKLYELNVGCITKYMIFKCTVTDAVTGKYIGTASLNITNSLDKIDGYTLVINNGVQSFKYSESGVAPTSKTLVNPFVIPELTFTVYDDLGRQVDSTAISQGKITWEVPCVNTMLSSVNGQNLEQNEQGYIIIENQSNLVYDIKNLYNIANKKNNIKLSINYKGLVLTATTDFTFIKQGDPGTNGTDFVFKIEPNIRSGSIPYYPTIFVNGTTVLGFNWNQVGNLSGGAWFKASLYQNNERIWTSGDGTNLVNTTWSILANNYFSGVSDISMLKISSQNKTTGVASFALNTSYVLNGNRAPANILKCTGTYNGVTYYATLPVYICLIYNTNYRAWLKEYTGFNYAIYTTDGRKPSYDNTEPFTVVVTEKFNGYDEDVTKTKVDGHNVTYNWSLLGSIATKENVSSNTPTWNDSATVLQKMKNLDNNYQYSVKPADDYRSECVTNTVRCEILRGETVVARLFMPVHTMLNRYGNARLNGWDGNSVTINNNEGFILAPQVGAGKKESDNSFTGVLMGQAKSIETGASKTQIGLLGYSKGKQSIFLDSQTGNATFGISGEGQILLRPGGTSTIGGWNINQKSLGSSINGNDVYLYSGNAKRSSKNSNTYTAFEASGRNGQDKVIIDYDGNIYANSGTIGNWKIGENTLTAGNITLDAQNNQININNKFVIYNDGTFKAANDSFSVDKNGKINASSGKIGNWDIGKNELSGGSIHMYSNTGQIKGDNWQINGNGYAKFTHVDITGDNKSTLKWGSGKFNVYEDGSMQASSGKIGGWTLSTTGLNNGGVSFTTNGGLKLGDTFSVTPKGVVSATAGTIGGCKMIDGILQADSLQLGQKSWTHNLTLVSDITEVSCTHFDVGFVTQVETKSRDFGVGVYGYDSQGTAIYSSGSVTVQDLVGNVAKTYFKVPSSITVSYSTKTLSILGNITGSNSSKSGTAFYSG